jgi:acetate kinase
MPSQEISCEGIVERIGSVDAILRYKTKYINSVEIHEIRNHKEGLIKLTQLLLDAEKGVISHVNEIDVVGHRVVHGGNTFYKTTLIDAEIKQKIRDLIPLAPLHNPHNLEGIEIAEEVFSKAKQVAVFDTAFHHTIPIKAKKYAIPDNYYDQFKIQVYGFHGTSHKYVSEKAIDYLEKENSKIISIHLGNGCSITAVLNGKSIDHSMGFAPSNGLIMGTRSGDIDQSIIFYLVNTLGYTLEDVNRLLIKKSGMFGLTGFSDLRDIQAEAEKGNQDCQLALAMNAYRIKKYIGSFSAVMNGLDAIVFTAGIGENSSIMRALVCEEMDFLGLELDEGKNKTRSNELREINTLTSRTKILVIPTNEELEIAKQTYNLVVSLKNKKD